MLEPNLEESMRAAFYGRSDLFLSRDVLRVAQY